MKTNLKLVLIIVSGFALASCSKLQNESVLATSNCTSCHGTAASPAPPPDVAGNTSISSPTVGAHQVHLAGSSFAAGVACSSCHIVPTEIGPGVHPDGPGSRDLVMFSGVAITETNTPGTRFYDSTLATVIPQPAFNRLTQTCQNTYCHGNFRGGNNFSPTWTSASASQDSCGSCHGLPPDDAVHQGKGITLQTCYYCHSPMIGADGVILNDSMHVTGKLVLYGKTLASW